MRSHPLLGYFAAALGCLAHAAAAAPDTKTQAPLNCQNTGNFSVWLDGFRKEAAAQGVSEKTIRTALGGVALDPGIIARDRQQKFFNQTFLEVVTKLATPNRLEAGKRAVQKYKVYFDKAHADYGVPASVITAFWALESDFGAGMGNDPVLRSLATLAYDCRRSELFRGELMAALKIIDRGDLSPGEMIGSWAGELGQTQFLPTHYLEHAVDGDGDGRRDLIHDQADLGWQRDQPWLEEVRVPAELPWAEADLAIQHPRSQWAEWGVTYADSRPIPKDQSPVSLLLPMGRYGPAFLAYPNFPQVYLQWNQSLNYSATAGYLATRIQGAPALRKGNGPVAALDTAQVKELQTMLTRDGFDVGRIDGTIGAGTRAAVKAMQKKFGLPQDSYPTPELLAALHGGRAPARTSEAEGVPPPPGPSRQQEEPPPKKKRSQKAPANDPFGLPW